jgi:hypothetical protein
MTRVDERSVGELLVDADLTCRQVLFDADAEHARALMRTWGEVVYCAGQLWHAIPDTRPDPTMARLEAMTSALQRSQARSGWPGPGPAHEHLAAVVESLNRATDLVTARTQLQAPLSPAGAADAAAARTRLMHTLYVGAHGVSVALGGYVTQMESRLANRERVPVGDSLVHARQALARVSVAENLAGAYVQARWPGALTGEHRDPPAGGRLERALAQWDVQAHRTLTASPTSAAVHWVAVVQRDTAVATLMVTRAAAQTRAIDAHQFGARLAPALVDVEASWAHLARQWQALTPRMDRRVDPPLLHAGKELRAALREITHDGAGKATPELVAQRVDLAATSATLGRSAATATELTHVLREVVNDPRMSVSAKAAHALAVGLAGSSSGKSWVDTADLHHDRAIHLPYAAREALTGALDRALSASTTADRASTVLDQPQPKPRALKPATVGTPTRSEDRARLSPSLAASGIGCER